MSHYHYVEITQPCKEELLECEKLFSSEIKNNGYNNPEEVIRGLDVLETLEISELPEGLLDFNESKVRYKKIHKPKPEDKMSVLTNTNAVNENLSTRKCLSCGAETGSGIFCSSCVKKMKRIAAIHDVFVSIDDSESMTTIGCKDKFVIYAHINNKTNNIMKIYLSEFYLVSRGKQRVESGYLSGCFFLNEVLLPHTTKCCAKTWDISAIGNATLAINDYVIVTLEYGEKSHMFKIVYNGVGWEIDDYFEM